MLLSSAVERFVSCVCAGKANETPRAYRAKLARLLAFLGDIPLESVQPVDLERFRQSLLNRKVKQRGRGVVFAPLSVWYVRGVLRTVKQFFRWCTDGDLIPFDPAERVKLPKAPQPRPKAIEQATFEKLLDAARYMGEEWERARNVALLYLLRDTGGRLGGILSAQVERVDLVRGAVTVIEKGDKQRDLFLVDISVAALGRWLAARAMLPVKSSAVFIGQRGKGLGRNGVYAIFRRLVRFAGIKGLRCNPHSFRHAFARDAIRAGADVTEVAGLLGHSTPRVTGEWYAVWLPSELESVHQRVSPLRNK